MEASVPGIHHITAMAGDPQQNIDFYTGVLGLRLIKVTVNFDDPLAYHLYYGDNMGRPGSVLTFFPWPGAVRGRRGTGQVAAITFAVPEGSQSYWRDRLTASGAAVEEPQARFGNEVAAFVDPDGLALELAATGDAGDPSSWARSPVPDEYAIRGFHSATLSAGSLEPTARLLSETLGFRLAAEESGRFRYQVGDGGPGAVVDIVPDPAAAPGQVSTGTVHHIAWRTGSDDEQEAWREKIADTGNNVTPVMDRRYFRSIYFREPGGALFEIATDLPGFAVDETPDRLGTALKLPPWLERVRSVIEEKLPRLRLPGEEGWTG